MPSDCPDIKLIKYAQCALFSLSRNRKKEMLIQNGYGGADECDSDYSDTELDCRI